MDERKSFLKLSQGGFRWGAAVKFTDLCPSLDRTWVQAKTQSTSFPKDFWHFTGLLSRWCTLKCSLVCHGWWVIRCYKEGARHHDWQLSPALAGVLARPWDRGSKCWALLHRHQLQRGQKMAASESRKYWLHFCTLRGKWRKHPIYIHSLWLVHTYVHWMTPGSLNYTVSMSSVRPPSAVLSRGEWQMVTGVSGHH